METKQRQARAERELDVKYNDDNNSNNNNKMNTDGLRHRNVNVKSAPPEAAYRSTITNVGSSRDTNINSISSNNNKSDCHNDNSSTHKSSSDKASSNINNPEVQFVYNNLATMSSNNINDDSKNSSLYIYNNNKKCATTGSTNNAMTMAVNGLKSCIKYKPVDAFTHKGSDGDNLTSSTVRSGQSVIIKRG
uniref:Uncharacterized protein n=1 Tax=Lygus hesperus TaxID=30085 RepID=A0A0A9WRC5_LYGHE